MFGESCGRRSLHWVRMDHELEGKGPQSLTLLSHASCKSHHPVKTISSPSGAQESSGEASGGQVGCFLCGCGATGPRCEAVVLHRLPEPP